LSPNCVQMITDPSKEPSAPFVGVKWPKKSETNFCYSLTDFILKSYMKCHRLRYFSRMLRSRAARNALSFVFLFMMNAPNILRSVFSRLQHVGTSRKCWVLALYFILRFRSKLFSVSQSG